MLSIIIPTLNEEKYLPLLLDSIKKQNFFDYEIIVADAESKDRTAEVAKNYGCKVVPGGLPAKGRNEGARVSKGEQLFFLDADAVLTGDFFEKSLFEFKERSLDIASFRLIPFPERKISLSLFNFFYNIPIVLLEKILPHAAMGILVKNELFTRLGGFDEEIRLAEDHYLARRAKKELKAKFGIIKSTKIFISDRRFKKDGWIKTGLKYLFCEIYMIFRGPAKSNIFKYRFDHYETKK